MKITTQKQVRDMFWRDYDPLSWTRCGKPHKFRGKSQNQLPTDVRCAFVDFVDQLARDGTISEALASRVTL